LIGGGSVLDPNPDKHRRFNEKVLKQLSVKASGNQEQIVLDFLDNSSALGSKIPELADYLNLSNDDVQKMISDLVKQKEVVKISGLIIKKSKLEDFDKEILDTLWNYHKKNRLQKGMPKEELITKFKISVDDNKIMEKILKKMAELGQINILGSLIAAGDFEVKYNKYQQKAHDEIISELNKSPLMPPNFDDLIGSDKTKEEVLKAIEGEEVLRLGEKNVMLKSAFDEVSKKVVDYLKENETMTLAEFRDLTGASRKYGMMTLEYMDKLGITRRKENMRILAKKEL